MRCVREDRLAHINGCWHRQVHRPMQCTRRRACDDGGDREHWYAAYVRRRYSASLVESRFGSVDVCIPGRPFYVHGESIAGIEHGARGDTEVRVIFQSAAPGGDLLPWFGSPVAACSRALFFSPSSSCRGGRPTAFLAGRGGAARGRTAGGGLVVRQCCGLRSG